MTAKAVERHLLTLRDDDVAKGHLRFFQCGPGQYGEGDRFLGISTAPLRAMAKEYTPIPTSEAVALLQSEWHEARVLALMILVRQYERGDERQRAVIYRSYLANTDRINNWDLVDVSAHLIAGAHLRERDRAPLFALARSESLWERRIAMVATLDFIRHEDLDDTFAIAALLLGDRHDLIHKAAGWMLREAGKRDQEALEKFLRKHKGTMPRTMLRYAIERFTPELRATYMAK